MRGVHIVSGRDATKPPFAIQKRIGRAERVEIVKQDLGIILRSQQRQQRIGQSCRIGIAHRAGIDQPQRRQRRQKPGDQRSIVSLAGLHGLLGQMQLQPPAARPAQTQHQRSPRARRRHIRSHAPLQPDIGPTAHGMCYI